MLSFERLQFILKKLQYQDTVEVKALAEELNVSPITIRRDLDKLMRQGKITRIFGGAASIVRPSAIELSFSEKEKQSLRVKQEIAYRASQMVEDKMSILLDSGTTTMALARLLTERVFTALRVITNDINIAYFLYTQEHIQTHMLGGEIVSQVGNTQGMFAVEQLKGLHCDIAFIGTSSIGNDLTLYTPTEEKVLLKKEMMGAASTSVLLVDSSKLGAVGSYKIVEVRDFDCCISDISWDFDQQKFLDDYSVDMIMVEGV